GELEPRDVPRLFCETAIAAARGGLALLTESVPMAAREAVGDGPLAQSLAAAAGEAALCLGAYANFLEAEVLPVASADFAASAAPSRPPRPGRAGGGGAGGGRRGAGGGGGARLGAALRGAQARLRPAAGSWQQCLAELDAEAPLASSPVAACQALVERLRG